MRLAAAAAVLCACQSDARHCDLASVYSDYIGGSATVFDCGNVQDDGFSGTDIALWNAAHDCVLQHAASQQPFLARWSVQGIEAPDAGAYVGVVAEGAWQLAYFEQRGRITGTVMPTFRHDCSALADKPSCNSLEWDLCIACSSVGSGQQCSP
ncbi:MAG: hypothetical protein JO257_35085 [Deltaproteobacteria bacterium]|nr:hypothetical protein [Deltaproteobacteria bacterium]